ncbi:MAG: hypothetical protein LBC39_04870 [Methanobrevibacter sp.]|nr:hypothetical protein [Candidatus Methanovirga aequatorialis]
MTGMLKDLFVLLWLIRYEYDGDVKGLAIQLNFLKYRSLNISLLKIL